MKKNHSTPEFKLAEYKVALAVRKSLAFVLVLCTVFVLVLPSWRIGRAGKRCWKSVKVQAFPGPSGLLLL